MRKAAMNRRRFVNLVVKNCSDDVCSLRRINPWRHLFYESTEEAEEKANDEKRKRFDKTLRRLPAPITSFDPSPTGLVFRGLDWFELFAPRSSEGRVIYSTMAGQMAMFDADRNLFLALPSLSNCKGILPMAFSVTHPGADEDSLYLMDWCPCMLPPRDSRPRSCFEVLEYMPRARDTSDHYKGWRCRLLPPPPFVRHDHAYITSCTTVDTADGCTSICVSTGNGFGTYCFDTARHDPNHRLGWSPMEEWRHVGEWELPFDGRAEHVRELDTWLGFEACRPCHLCAVDLSEMDRGRAPTVELAWEDRSLTEKEDRPVLLRLVNLGGGRFCIAKAFNDYDDGIQFAVLTGVEMLRDERDQSLRVVKHKRVRYASRTDTIRWVL